MFGESLIADPYGNIVTKAGPEEWLIYADIDLATSRSVRADRPYFRLRRPEMYE